MEKIVFYGLPKPEVIWQGKHSKFKVYDSIVKEGIFSFIILVKLPTESHHMWYMLQRDNTS